MRYPVFANKILAKIATELSTAALVGFAAFLAAALGAGCGGTTAAFAPTGPIIGRWPGAVRVIASLPPGTQALEVGMVSATGNEETSLAELVADLSHLAAEHGANVVVVDAVEASESGRLRIRGLSVDAWRAKHKELTGIAYFVRDPAAIPPSANLVAMLRGNPVSSPASAATSLPATPPTETAAPAAAPPIDSPGAGQERLEFGAALAIVAAGNNRWNTAFSETYPDGSTQLVDQTGSVPPGGGLDVSARIRMNESFRLGGVWRFLRLEPAPPGGTPAGADLFSLVGPFVEVGFPVARAEGEIRLLAGAQVVIPMQSSATKSLVIAGINRNAAANDKVSFEVGEISGSPSFGANLGIGWVHRVNRRVSLAVGLDAAYFGTTYVLPLERLDFGISAPLNAFGSCSYKVLMLDIGPRWKF